jgi:glycine dehydrogenase
MSIDHLVPVTTGTSTETVMADFVSRHVGPAGDDVLHMLEVVGQPSLDAMCDRAIPGAIRSGTPLRVEAAASESAVIEELRGFAARNTVLTSLIGLGYYGTVTPPVVRRNVLENPAWYTAYTPYQPEISQGRLEALLNFQTVITDLTGLDVAGSSLLDESTAAAEAMSLMRRASKAPADAVVLVDERLFPQTIAVMRTRADALGLPLLVADLRGVTDADSLTSAAGGRAVVGAMVQYPDAIGELVDWAPLTAAVHEAKGLVTACADLLALTLAVAPGEWGADIAVGSAQRFGVPMGFGGPHAGYMAVHRGLERQIPGRLVGVSVDAEGHQAYRLALQTREQHIRREKATSNICTAQVLLAVMASMYAVWHGPPDWWPSRSGSVPSPPPSAAPSSTAASTSRRPRSSTRSRSSSRVVRRRSRRPSPTAASTCGASTPTASRSASTRRPLPQRCSRSSTRSGSRRRTT